MSNNYPVYLPIRIKNAEKDQDRIFPEVSNIDLQSIQKQVTKPVIVFDLDQNILIQVSPDDILKVGLDTDGETIDALLHGLDVSVPGPIQNGDMVITAFGKTQRQLNEAFTNIANLFSTKTTSDLAEGSNQYFTQSRARSAAIQNSINPSETQRGASQRAVHLALESLRTTLEDLISLESTARVSDVQALSNQIDAVILSLNNEIQNRTDADQILADSIQDESQLRLSAINSLLNDLNNLLTQLNTETTNRENADLSLQSQIDGKQDILQLKTLFSESLIGTGNITFDKNDVGLGNVDNTSDSNKPISNATQSELNRIEALALDHPSLNFNQGFSDTIQQSTSTAWSNLIGGEITPPSGTYFCIGVGEFYLRTSEGEQWGEFGLALNNDTPANDNIGEAYPERNGGGSVQSTVMSFCTGFFSVNGTQTIRLRYRSRNGNEIQVWRRNIRIIRIN